MRNIYNIDIPNAKGRDDLMKRITTLLLAVAMVFGLAACGGAASDSVSDEKVVANEAFSGEITFWNSFTQGARMEAMACAVDKFQTIYPNVEVHVETMSWADFKDRWKEGMETGNLPDISTTCNMYELEELYDAGILQPTDDVIDAIGRDLFSDNVLSELSHEGAVYGVPYYSHAYVMWYREDLLKAAGYAVPTTWEELYETAKAVTDPQNNVYGCPVSMSENDFLATIYLHMYVRSGGGSLLNDDLSANLTDDLAIEGIRYWAKMYEDCSPKETADYTVVEQATLFYEGTTAFDFNSGFHISGVAGAREDLLDAISCVSLPRMYEGDDYYSAVVTHIPLVLYKDAKNVELCKAFLEFLYEEENYIDFLDSVPVGMLPSIRGVSSTEKYQSNEMRKRFSEEEAVIQEAMLGGVALGFEHGPNLQAGILTSSGVIEKMFQKIVLEGADVEAAAQEAEDELNRLFEAAKEQ